MREFARERARKRTSGHQRTAIEAHLLSRKFIAHAASELRRPLSDSARQNDTAAAGILGPEQPGPPESRVRRRPAEAVRTLAGCSSSPSAPPLSLLPSDPPASVYGTSYFLSTQVVGTSLVRRSRETVWMREWGGV